MTETLLPLSTAHLRFDTCNAWLHRGEVVAYEKGDYGWFVFVGGDDDDRADAVPDDLAACITFARNNHSDWLMFDRDAPALPDLPTYVW